MKNIINENSLVSKSRIKISILSSNLSENCLGRAYILAKILSKRFDVEILGPMIGKGIWVPLKNDSTIKYTILPLSIINLFRIIRKINGDIIYAIKPVMTSFGYGLIKKVINNKPLILDIDDWELGFLLDYSKWDMIKSCLAFWDANNLFYTYLLERLVKFADYSTTSSIFLQKKFGGILIPHARDTDIFDPKRYDRTKFRDKFEVRTKKVVMFLGTIRKHKGIDNLIDAIDLLKDEDIILMLVGVDFNDPYIKKLIGQSKNYIKFIGQQPFEKIPEFLSAADLVVLPQKETYSARGQVPVKVFDAMMMEKPIIATNISDLPQILKDCGIIIEPANIELLAEKIKFVFDNPEIARDLGIRARKKCIKEYSFVSLQEQLFSLFDQCYIESKNK